MMDRFLRWFGMLAEAERITRPSVGGMPQLGRLAKETDDGTHHTIRTRTTQARIASRTSTQQTRCILQPSTLIHVHFSLV